MWLAVRGKRREENWISDQPSAELIFPQNSSLLSFQNAHQASWVVEVSSGTIQLGIH